MVPRSAELGSKPLPRQGERPFQWPDLGVYALYGLGVVFYTYPMASDFSRPFSAIGDYLIIIYALAWQWHALLADPANFFNANIMFPAQSALAIATPLNTAQLIFFVPGWVLTGDTVKAINAVYWGNIFCSAASTYYVLRRYGASRCAAFVGGWIFGFAIGKIFQNFQFPFFWLVWTLHFWHQFLCRPRLRSLLATALSFVAMSLGSFYLMYMGFLGLAAWSVGFHLEVRSLLRRRFIVGILGAGALAGLLLLPFGLPYFSVNKTYGLKRPMGEAIQYSADLLSSYVLPNNRSVLYEDLSFGAQYSPLPGEEWVFDGVTGLVQGVAGASVLGDRGYGEALSYRTFHSIWTAGEGERRSFLGYSVVLLVVLAWCVKPPPILRRERYLLTVLLLASIVLSAGPVVVLLGHLTYIPTPYALLYYLLPGLQGMRATARFGYVAMLAAAVLAAYGWWALEKVLERQAAARHYPRRVVLTVALAVWIGLFSLENLPGTRRLHERPEDPPAVYGWLKSRQIEGGIIEIPTFKGSMRKTDPVYGSRRVEYSHREYLYMYYSPNHWKPIYNGFGAFISPLQFEVRDAVESLPDSGAIDFLKGLGLNTFILHRYWFEAEDEVFWSRPEVLRVLEQVEVVGGAEVYRLR